VKSIGEARGVQKARGTSAGGYDDGCVISLTTDILLLIAIIFSCMWPYKKPGKKSLAID
jgi:hypothetical protein